ncbi:MAG: hypothetical protein J1F67_08930 [Muribaculaceae bacterium]|nr:hypothetical protein [Muribaculaceae bacterium]
MGKYIIALIAPNETGKTTVINNVWDLLPCFYPEEKVILNDRKYHEIVGYVDGFKNIANDHHPIHRPYRVGVNSLGDTVNQIKEGLAVLIHHKCNIIICSARAELPKDGRNDWESMLKDAISGISNTDLHENHLDLINEISPDGIKKEDLEYIAEEVKNYEIITCGHFRDFKLRGKPLKHTNEDPEPGIIRIPDNKGLNVDRISAQNIVNLIERIQNNY